MPKKSNVHDYTNRPSSGPRLGELIGNALVKEAEKHAKAVQRQAEKARKVSNASTRTNVSDLPVKEQVLHTIDLKAPGKGLGDAGSNALCEGLQKALAMRDCEATLALEDLNLSSNGITTATLPALASAIELAKFDIKTLDLSKNNITVSSSSEAAAWTIFLESFKHCHRLRRLDLSGNHLGTLAMEILARIHTREDDIDYIRSDRRRSVITLPDDQVSECAGSLPKSITPIGQGLEGSMSCGTVLQRRNGLRSIPFVDLTNTSLTDSGALWLSYMLVDHPYPVQLIDGLNSPDLDNTVQAYQQGEEDCGVAWLSTEDSKLGRDGIALLKKAEAVRRECYLPDDEDDEEQMDTITRINKRRDSRALRGNRRMSLVHQPEEDLKMLRNKVQRSIIGHGGVASVELWDAALQVVNCSRTLMASMPTTRRLYTAEALVTGNADAAPTAPTASTQDTPSPSLPFATAHARTASSKAAGLPGVFVGVQQADQRINKRSYATTLRLSEDEGNNSNSIAITEVTNASRTPKIILTHRKGASSEGTDLHAATVRLQNLTTREKDERDGSEPWLAFQKRVLAVWPYQDLENITHLPLGLLRTMMVDVVGHGVEVLSDEQFKQAVEWGLDRESLALEREWVKLDESSQKWHLLEKAGCLAY